VALVTGAGGGIGSATVSAFEAAGAQVSGVDREVEVSDPSATASAVGAVVRRFGALHILVNAAGVALRGPALEVTLDEWDRVLAVNLRGTFFACQAAARTMARADGGSIVNVASELAFVGVADRSAYIASKAGVAGLTRALAVEWAPLGIRVNAVAPGLTRTPMTADLSAEDVEAYRRLTPDQRVAEPADIAAAIVFLASDASRHVVGQVLTVDGGFSIA
jgi:NAD(P)-dependent dehydrogenase (short-subunit alcohol dehydrogenase family)